MRVSSTPHGWNIKDECKQNNISSIKIKNTHNQDLCLKQRTERQREEQRPHYPAIKEENAWFMVVMSWWCHTSRFYGAGYVLSAASSPRDGTSNEAKERESEIRGLQQLKRNGVFQITYLCTAHFTFFQCMSTQSVPILTSMWKCSVLFVRSERSKNWVILSMLYWWCSRSNVKYLLWSTVPKKKCNWASALWFMCDVMCCACC